MRPTRWAQVTCSTKSNVVVTEHFHCNSWGVAASTVVGVEEGGSNAVALPPHADLFWQPADWSNDLPVRSLLLGGPQSWPSWQNCIEFNALVILPVWIQLMEFVTPCPDTILTVILAYFKGLSGEFKCYMCQNVIWEVFFLSKEEKLNPVEVRGEQQLTVRGGKKVMSIVLYVTTVYKKGANYTFTFEETVFSILT